MSMNIRSKGNVLKNVCSVKKEKVKKNQNKTPRVNVVGNFIVRRRNTIKYAYTSRRHPVNLNYASGRIPYTFANIFSMTLLIIE